MFSFVWGSPLGFVGYVNTNFTGSTVVVIHFGCVFSSEIGGIWRHDTSFDVFFIHIGIGFFMIVHCKLVKI